MKEQNEGGSRKRSTADSAKAKASELTDRAGSAADTAASEARAKGREAVEEGKERARELGDEASRVARSRAEDQKDRVAEGFRTVAHALRNGSRDLDEDGQPYGRFIETVADRIDDVSDYVDRHDVDGLTREARRFARDHTPLFLGGAFALGIAGARFLKSSDSDTGRSRHREHESEHYGRRIAEPGHGQPRRTEPFEAGRREPPAYRRVEDPVQAAERTQREGGYA